MSKTGLTIQVNTGKTLVQLREKLTPKQISFCDLYASDREFFGNGVQSYMEAYGLDINKKNYQIAKSEAYKNLTKPHLLEYINAIYETRGLSEAFVDKQLEKVINQDADFKSKVAAIKEFNKLKGRIIQKTENLNKTVTIGAVLHRIQTNNDKIRDAKPSKDVDNVINNLEKIKL